MLVEEEVKRYERQIRIFGEKGQEKLKKLNPNVEVEVISKRINTGNVDELVSGFDMIVDAMDNLRGTC